MTKAVFECLVLESPGPREDFLILAAGKHTDLLIIQICTLESGPRTGELGSVNYKCFSCLNSTFYFQIWFCLGKYHVNRVLVVENFSNVLYPVYHQLQPGLTRAYCL